MHMLLHELECLTLESGVPVCVSVTKPAATGDISSDWDLRHLNLCSKDLDEWPMVGDKKSLDTFNW